MEFNPDVRKQTQEVIFSRNQANSVHPDLVFNNTAVYSWLKAFSSIHRHEIKLYAAYQGKNLKSNAGN